MRSGVLAFSRREREVLTARDLNPEVRIVAAATNRENISKLRRAGADSVVSPIAQGARMLVDATFEP